ncbi:MAG TPA: biopolymer transporter ExbD [Lacipirellulaceae bacterium]|nr:biopolymer transporter ExbD [Lacipirellulaceae bacterium]
MNITFRCPYCGKKLSASERSAGKQKTCPNCRGRVTVPESLEAARTANPAVAEPRTAADHPLLLMPKRMQHRDLIDMTAMVDIVFFLLIFFLVTSMQSVQAVINLPAPQAPSSAPNSVQAVPDLANDSDQVLVTIDSDDAIWVEDQEALSDQDLRSKLRAARQKNDRTSMMIKCSPNSTHGTFVSVLDAGADAGMTEIQFSVPHSDDSSSSD